VIDNYAVGMFGQVHAEKFLRAKGYQILHKNYHTKTGEIDIVAKQGSYIIFAEVKFRKSLAHGYPRESVTPAKQRKIHNAALHYIAAHPQISESDFRFDVLEVLGDDKQVYINHIEDAFCV